MGKLSESLENCAFGKLKYFIKSSIPVFVFPLASRLVFHPPQPTSANLSQDLPLGVPGKDGFPCKGIWEERSKTYYGLACPEF